MKEHETNCPQLFLRYFTIAIWLVVLSGLFYSCTAQADTFDTQWTFTSRPIPTRAYIITTSIEVACKDAKTLFRTPLACAKRVYYPTNHDADICIIFLPERYPMWLRLHEEKHCDGWDHD